MWRFKTEKEFIKEFGFNWKRGIVCSWNTDGNMDHLLGWAPSSVKDQAFIQSLFDGKILSSHIFFPSKNMKCLSMCWQYSTDMFTKASHQLEFDF
jgi:hypothetical protein